MYELKTLIIAEKPSVANDIVKALGHKGGAFEKHNDHFENPQYVVTSAVGHLLEIQAPPAYEVKRGKWSFAHLPVIPPHFEVHPIDKTKARLQAVVKLAKRKDIGAFINACDAGREGELIFRLIAQYANLQKPIQRLWLQSMTPQAIRDGFATLRSDSQMQGLADAARSRSEADWLVGINGTRALTAFNSREGGFFLTTVGRVQTPTLSIVVEREEKIRRFVARDYAEIHAKFGVAAGSYAARWFDAQWQKNETDAEHKAERLWDQAQAERIVAAVQGCSGTVREETKPSTQSSQLLFDLTSLQREANTRFGFSAKTTLSLAQSLYERHKALTYPRTDSRALPEDYVGVAQKTMAMLAEGGIPGLAPHAAKALKEGYVRMQKRVFDNSRVRDHFAIIPTTEVAHGLNELEQKLYELVAKRFMAVFYPSAEYLNTTRITIVAGEHFKTEGKVLVKPGWRVIYGAEADADKDDGPQNLVPIVNAEAAKTLEAAAKWLRTKPPARYNEATLLGAMEGAGKLIDDEALRLAMQEKGLGTPATRAATIEGLLDEKYMLREGRDLVPTAKAFQLMTLLRGLGIEELSKPALTGEWEEKLARMEQGKLSRSQFMQEIAQMTERLVQKAREYDRETIPGDYATLHNPCPACGGAIRENYRRYACVGAVAANDAAGSGCGFSFSKILASRAFDLAEVESLLQHKKIGPLTGFRSKAGWPFAAGLRLIQDPDGTVAQGWKVEFDFGDDKAAEDGAAADFSAATRLGACPACGGGVYERGQNYVCEKSLASADQPASCTFRTGKVILQQPISPEQMQKLLHDGRTDLLDKFVSVRTRRTFKAFLQWDASSGKVGFVFEPKGAGAKRYSPRATADAAAPTGKTVASKSAIAKAPAKKAATKKAAAKKTGVKKTPAKKPAHSKMVAAA